MTILRTLPRLAFALSLASLGACASEPTDPPGPTERVASTEQAARVCPEPPCPRPGCGPCVAAAGSPLGGYKTCTTVNGEIEDIACRPPAPPPPPPDPNDVTCTTSSDSGRCFRTCCSKTAAGHTRCGVTGC